MCLLIAFVWSSLAWGDDQSRIQAEVTTIAEGAAALASSNQRQTPIADNTRVTSRLNDAQVFYLSKQYSRSAIILMDLADRPGISAHPAYSDIVYYLADSLFQMSNDKSASDYFKILKARASKQRKEWAVGRLLQICARRDDVEFCDENRRAALNQITRRSLPSLKYSLGKSLYQNDELPDARRVFSLIGPQDDEWLKSVYFIGVIHVKEGNLETSLNNFKKVLTAVEAFADSASDEQRLIANQARLALARVHYELGGLDKALDNYNQVGRQSSAFDEAIQESVWVSIKRGDYDKSLRQLELLMIKQDDITRGYKSQLLKGRLLILLNEYARAQESFGKVTDAFLPIRDQLEKTIKRHPDLEGYFQRKIGGSTGDVDVTSFMPKAALDAVGDGLEADQAVVLVQEVSAQRRDVESAKRTVEKLRNALASDMRLEMFPELQTGYLGAGELLNRSLLVEAKINELDGNRVSDGNYRQVRTERQRLEVLFKKVPVTAIDLKNRRRKMNEKLRQLDMEVNRLQADLTGVDAQLTAIRRFQESQPSRSNAKDVAAELERTRILRKELKSLIWSLEDERAKLGTQDYAARGDARIRQAFRRSLENESKLLRANNTQSESLRSSIANSRRLLDEYQTRVERKVVALVREIRAEVESESRKLAKFESELRLRERDTSRLGGAIAADTYRRVYRSIRGVVLEADVGMVNMAWKQKQDPTVSIRKMQERKSEDIGRLEDMFNEVTGE